MNREDFGHKNANLMIVIIMKGGLIIITKGVREKEHDKEKDDEKNIYLKSESIVVYIMSHDTAYL